MKQFIKTLFFISIIIGITNIHQVKGNINGLEVLLASIPGIVLTDMSLFTIKGPLWQFKRTVFETSKAILFALGAHALGADKKIAVAIPFAYLIFQMLPNIYKLNKFKKTGLIPDDFKSHWKKILNKDVDQGFYHEHLLKTIQSQIEGFGYTFILPALSVGAYAILKGIITSVAHLFKPSTVRL